MDGGRRLTQSLSSFVGGWAQFVRAAQILSHSPAWLRFDRASARVASRVAAIPLPRGTGVMMAVGLCLASLVYGVIRGEQIPHVVATLKEARDAVASAAGFRIASVAIEGRKQVSEADVLRTAGATDRASLLFLDVEEARTRLKAIPWIAEATVRKFYPDRLLIRIEERAPFALWQQQGKLSIIAADGTVLAPLTERKFAALPLVVGRGAAPRAKEFLALLDRQPAIRDQVRAAILVAERRWNLRLKNGLDVRLPETDVERALAALVTLDAEKKLLSRDVTVVDMRLADRVTVRLSDDAARAREDALKAKAKRKAGDA